MLWSEIGFLVDDVAYILIKDLTTPMPAVVRSFNILILVVFVCLLAYVALRLMGNAKFTRSTRRNLQIVESISVGPQSFVHIVRAGGQYVLVGVTRGQVSMLTSLEPDQLKIQSPSQTTGFETFFNMFRKESEWSTDQGGDGTDFNENTRPDDKPDDGKGNNP